MRIDPGRLRLCRENAGLSQQMLAERTAEPDSSPPVPPLSVSYISQLERAAKTDPSPWVVGRIAQVLGCEIADLRADGDA